MRVLIACEESQTVCKAFRERGHEAYSCDILPCEIYEHLEWHIMDDALKVINGNCSFETMDGRSHAQSGQWDLIIAHPPCTYLSNAGARWLYAGNTIDKKRYKKGLEGKAFFLMCLNSNSKRVCVENPIPSSVYGLPPYTQVIQPYEYGHPYSKKTCLWLKGLPMLKPTKIMAEHKPFIVSGTFTKTHDRSLLGVSRAGGSAKARSKTFPGIAEAMAEQWGCLE